MRRIAYILLLTTALASGCKKETLHWQKVVPIKSHTASRLNKIAFLNNDHCVIGGGEKYEKAEALVSTDGGNSWVVKSFPEAGKGMYGLGIAPSGKFYFSGFDGRIIYSGDITADWQVSQVMDWRYYVGIAYPAEDTGIYISTAVDGRAAIVRVDSNFQIIDSAAYDFTLNDIDFPTRTTGYVAAFGTVLKTTNGGNQWAILDIKDDNFMAVYSIEENDVWVCGYNGSIRHTTDGGTTWKKLRSGNNFAQSRYRLRDIVFRDKLTGWAVGEEGLIIRTDDGGATWTPYKSFTDVTLLSIAVGADGNILVCGEKGAIYKLYQ